MNGLKPALSGWAGNCWTIEGYCVSIGLRLLLLYFLLTRSTGLQGQTLQPFFYGLEAREAPNSFKQVREKQ
jgi:hypothetical protein